MTDAKPSTSNVDETAIERFDPEALHGGMLAAEHMARYRWVTQFVSGRRVLDAASGTGYGTAMLAAAGATAVVGIDIDEETVARARKRYEDIEQFDVGDVRALPYEDASFDVIISFETIEHVPDPESALDEFRRVLKPDGFLIVSTPNNVVYPPGNPHHVREYGSQEFVDELTRRFEQVAVRRQHNWIATGILDDSDFAGTEGDELKGASVRKLHAYQPGEETYTIVIAGAELPAEGVPVVALNEPVELREWDLLWHEQAQTLADQDTQLRDQADQLSEQADQLRDQADQLRNQNVQLRNQNVQLRDQAELLSQQADQLTDQAAAIREQIGRSDARDVEVTKLRAALLAAEADLADRREIESDLSQSQHVLDVLREQITGLREQITDLREQVGDLQTAHGAILAERDQWIRNYEVVVNSSSWKLTVPWRMLGGYVRGRRARGA